MDLSTESFIKLVCLVSCSSFFVMPKTIGEGNLDATSHMGTMRALLFSMEKAVSFYSQNVEKVNLDSLFGLRVGQGRLQIFDCGLLASAFLPLAFQIRSLQHLKFSSNCIH